MIGVRLLCFQFTALISQGLEVRGHKSGSWQMSGWLKFLHCDLMLTRERIWIWKYPFPVHLYVRFAQDVPAVITRECLEQKSRCLHLMKQWTEISWLRETHRVKGGLREERVFWFWADNYRWQWKTHCLFQRKTTHAHINRPGPVALMCCPNFDLCIWVSQAQPGACGRPAMGDVVLIRCIL